jgi:hypothetical protein
MLLSVILLQGWMILALISFLSFLAVVFHDDGGGMMAGLENMVYFFVYWLPFNGLMWLIYFIIN